MGRGLNVQFLVQSPSRPVAQVREEMLKFGADCVLVVGDESLMKVHVHTLQPDEIIRIGLTAGRIGDVVVEDLDAMTAEHERTTGIVVAPATRVPAAEVGVVAVVPGEGVAKVARSLGASALRGGATMNPSTEEFPVALLAGRVVAHGDDEVTALCDAAKRLTDAEIFTLYSGADVDEARIQHAAQRLRATCPRVSVEIAHGGQPHYPFIVAAE